MAENIFQGAKRIKEETEEIMNALEGVKKLKSDLEKLSKAFDKAESLKWEIERLEGKIERINKTVIGSLENDFKKLEEKTEKMVENKAEIIIDWWKLWVLFLPAIVLFTALIMAGYVYFTSIRSLKEQNDILRNRIISIYHAQVLDDKYWYDKKNKKLFLEDYKWIEEELKEEKERAKKK